MKINKSENDGHLYFSSCYFSNIYKEPTVYQALHSHSLILTEVGTTLILILQPKKRRVSKITTLFRTEGGVGIKTNCSDPSQSLNHCASFQ